MVLWIGVDDTDSLRGMCTTFLATEIVRELTKEYDLIGYPRLVRLNPNIPWKTRGNGAICLRVGRGRGVPRSIGRIETTEVRAYPRGDDPANPGRVEAVVGRLVERWSCLDDETTNPGFVVLHRQPAVRMYWRAVRGIVEKTEALQSAAGLGCIRQYKNGRGVIGAIAATAWRPRDRTYEIMAYRETARWGSQRNIDSESVADMDLRFPSTFNNLDRETLRIAIVPHSPCPVLFGIRGEDPQDLPAAARTIRGEGPARLMVFETNQGTDDHVVPRPTDDPLTAGVFTGKVTCAPHAIQGGHVIFRMGKREVVAYEPSKGFRRIVRELTPNDRLRVVASVRDRPRVLNLEKMGIIELSKSVEKVANPLCLSCGRRMKSRGRSAGFRCGRCHRVAPVEAAAYRVVPRHVQTGWYEPPVCSRRHLSKPLKRGVPRPF
ncbi:MAG TPA: tRNA(Ile)(2)-agmatinylcytidine synthase [Thermoplasmata archaeon]